MFKVTKWSGPKGARSFSTKHFETETTWGNDTNDKVNNDERLISCSESCVGVGVVGGWGIYGIVETVFILATLCVSCCRFNCTL